LTQKSLAVCCALLIRMPRRRNDDKGGGSMGAAFFSGDCTPVSPESTLSQVLNHVYGINPRLDVVLSKAIHLGSS
jgi:hypothetical protein